MVVLQIIGVLEGFLPRWQWKPKDLNGFYRVFSGSNGRYRVLPGFTEFFFLTHL